MLTPLPAGRRRALVPVIAIVLLMSACRVDLEVHVVVEEGGSGEVRAAVLLDEAATRHVPGLADQLEVDDLLAAGWVVEGPATEDDGRTVVRARRSFVAPDDADAALDELTGPDGPFGDLSVRHEQAFAHTRHRLTGRVDLRDGVDAFADDALRERLDGNSLGVDVAELERRAGVPIADALRVELTATLPESGGRSSTTRWAPRLGEVVVVDAAGDVRNTSRLVWSALSVLAVVAAAGVALDARRRRAAGVPPPR